MTSRTRCELLDQIQQEIVSTFHEARKIRRSKDLSFSEDAELTRSEHKKIDELVRHLLAGHDGEPCPAGDRPIITGENALNPFTTIPPHKFIVL
jgi:hypothetical protein